MKICGIPSCFLTWALSVGENPVPSSGWTWNSSVYSSSLLPLPLQNFKEGIPSKLVSFFTSFGFHLRYRHAIHEISWKLCSWTKSSLKCWWFKEQVFRGPQIHLWEWTVECPSRLGHSVVFSLLQGVLSHLHQPRSQIKYCSRQEGFDENHLWANKEADIAGVWSLFPFRHHIDIVFQGLQIYFILRLLIWIFPCTL